MKTQRKIVTYVSANPPTTDGVNSDGQIEFQLKNSLVELFPLMGDPKFKTDLIILDIEKIDNTNGTSIFDIINTLSILIKCTVERTGTGKPIKRDTKICAAMSTDVDREIARDFLNMKEINGFLINLNDSTADDFNTALTEISAGIRHLPKRLREHLYPKRKKYDDHTIRLTPRQSQILQLVANRGASNKVIAKILDISESTVKLHMSAILKKFGVRNRTQLAIFSRN